MDAHTQSIDVLELLDPVCDLCILLCAYALLIVPPNTVAARNLRSLHIRSRWHARLVGKCTARVSFYLLCIAEFVRIVVRSSRHAQDVC